MDMETLTVAIMHNKLEEMTSNVNLLTFDIDKSFFFFFQPEFSINISGYPRGVSGQGT